jgi:hypothetical protein
MGKRRAGLHKQVCEIFDGVPLPKDDGAEQALAAPTLERPNNEGCPKGDKGRLETPAPPKPAAPSHLTPATPKAQEQKPVQLPPKAAPAKQRAANAAIKSLKQIPWQQKWEQISSRLFASKQGVSDTRQKTMVILVPVLFIVLIFVFSQVLSMSSHKITKAQSFGPTGTVGGSNKIDWQIPDPYPATLRDPMQLSSVATAQTGMGTSELIIKGIVYSEDNSSAVIGEQIVHEGDEVLGVTIIKINEKSIDFEMNGKKWTQKVQ